MTSSKTQYKSKRQQKLAQKQSLSKSFTHSTQTQFRDAERNFKSRLPPPTFDNVIDFYNLDQCSDEIKNKIMKIELKVELGKEDESEEKGNIFGDYNELKEGEDVIKGERKVAYLIKDIPGFIFIPNPFTPKVQKNIIKRCLKDFAKYPNKSNLDTHYILPKEGLWNLYEKGINSELNENDVIPLRASVIGQDSLYEKEADAKQELPQTEISQKSLIEKENRDKEKEEKVDEKAEPLPSPGVPILSPSQLIKKLRWVTLGYQYHWPTKTYHLEKRFSFPKDIELLTTFVIKSINGIKFIEKNENNGEQYFINDYDHKKWKPEAGVVNYYQLKDNLMAHVDKSEFNMEAPLISFSFGHTCIFLIGGITRDIAPIALYLRSGDISVMCGPCRANFHGVPRILEGTLPRYLEPNYDDDPEWKIYGDFMSTTRINVNVRQVF